MPSLQTEELVWTLIHEPAGRPGSENMALDAALLEEADRRGRAFLRLYRFDPPCLSFGRNEAAREQFDARAIERLRIDVVRRPTGGRAVWHEHEVTYAVAAPIDLFGSLGAAYRAIHARLAAALRSLGVEVTFATGHRMGRAQERSSPCFARAAGGEIVAGGRKLVGSAQVRRGGAFLQHGSILLGGSQGIISALSRRPAGVGGETTLSALLGRPVTFDEVAEAITAVWGDDLTSTALQRPPPPSAAPFRDPAWTWRR